MTVKNYLTLGDIEHYCCLKFQMLSWLESSPLPLHYWNGHVRLNTLL